METYTYVIAGLLPVFGGLIAFFLRSLFQTINQKFEVIQSLESELRVINVRLKHFDDFLSSSKPVLSDWPVLREQTTRLLVYADTTHKLVEEIAVIKRDQATVWRHIDELKTDN